MSIYKREYQNYIKSRYNLDEKSNLEKKLNVG